MDITFYLDSIDSFIFFFFNKTLANPFFDKFMPFITEAKHWLIFYFLVLFYLLIKGGAKGRVAVIMALVLVFCTDQSSNILKELFMRIRPCHTLPNVNLLVGCTESYSFPSNHAMNNFAAAVLFSHFYPKMKVWLFSGATIVAMSRVFVGVHYVSDIIGGAIVGTLIALGLLYIWKLINNKFKILKA